MLFSSIQTDYTTNITIISYFSYHQTKVWKTTQQLIHFQDRDASLLAVKNCCPSFTWSGLAVLLPIVLHAYCQLHGPCFCRGYRRQSVAAKQNLSCLRIGSMPSLYTNTTKHRHTYFASDKIPTDRNSNGRIPRVSCGQSQ